MKIHGIEKYQNNNQYKSSVKSNTGVLKFKPDCFEFSSNHTRITSFGKHNNTAENLITIQTSSIDAIKNPFIPGIKQYKDFIQQLANVDSDILKKKISLLQQAETETKSNFEQSRRFKEFSYILLNEDLSPEGMNSLFKLIQKDKRSKNFNYWGNKTDRLYSILTGSAIKYPEFDKMSIADKLSLIKDLSWDYRYVNEETAQLLTGLNKFPLYTDLKESGSIDNLISKLNKKIYEPQVEGIHFARINVPEQNIENFENAVKPDNIKQSLQGCNLDEYSTTGLPLKFTRKDFINRFKSLPDSHELAAYFNFSIDESDDIIGFPNPSGGFSSLRSENAKKSVHAAKKLVEDFTINNKVIIPDNKEAQKFFNIVIQAFPELTSIIGKKQNQEHANTLDIHTFKVIKNVVLHPLFEELTESEKRVLIVASLFHDIGKKEGSVDYEHPQKSAAYSLELMKKLQFNSLEKERLFNLIDMGHWAQYMSNESKTAEDIAAVFRHPNDFKMAKIFSFADLISVSRNLYESLKDIQKNHAINVETELNNIKRKGIVLFADDIPSSYTQLPKNDDGIFIIDFTDKNSDVSYLGYPKGTKVKDLKMLAHSSDAPPKEFTMECSPSHKICLSTSLLDDGNFRTLYNSKTHVIIKPVNSDIAVVSKGLCSSGFQRGFEEFKKYLFDTTVSNFKSTKINPEERRLISDIIREDLNLDSDEYAQMYEQLASVNDLNNIKDISLKNGRIILKEDIINSVKHVQSFLLQEIDPRDYKNEVVVFSPKIAAFVEDSREYENNTELKQVAKENNIPVILV